MGIFWGLFFGEEMFIFGFFGWSFEIAAIDFAVIDKVGAVFFDEDFDAAGDRNGDNRAG